MALRVEAFIDGFNFYHSLPVINESRQYRWLNLHKLCRSFCRRDDLLSSVYCFTALAPWDGHKRKRHETYIQALESTGVKIIQDRFQNVTRKCRRCKNEYKTFEKKHTDVNMALQLLRSAYENKCDKFLIITADSDFAPAIQMIARKFPDKSMQLVLPFQKHSKELEKELLQSSRGHKSKIKIQHLQDNLFPDQLTKEIIKPSLW